MEPVADEPAPGARSELLAALVTVVGCLALAAPAGLLWAALSPDAVVVLRDGVPSTSAEPSLLIATDGAFLLVVALAGLLTGLVAVLLGRRCPLGTALGLAVGGLLAAEVARRTGILVGREEAREVLAAGADASATLPVQLRSWQALVGWPLTALGLHTAVTGWLVWRARRASSG